MKLNVVIDASGMFYRSLFSIGNYGIFKGKKILDTKKSREVFMRKLATDFTSIIRDIENISRVVVCLDSSSWRKSILIKDGKYKNEREEKKQELPINWNVFYELIDEFANILSKKGYILSKINGAEADDLLFLWSKKFNSDGENVILITGDRDLLQVVSQNENDTWTISLDPVNKRKKISLMQETFDKIDTHSSEFDFFDTDTWFSSDDVLKKLMQTYEVNIVNPQFISLEKVILGDDGDAIPGCVTWVDKNDASKIRSISINNFQKILIKYPDLKNCTWKDLNEGKYVDEIVSTMEDIKKIKLDKDVILNNIQRNCKLAVLSMEIIPESIKQAFNIAHQDVKESNVITNRNLILEGTEWWTDKASDVPKFYDIFNEDF